MRSLWLAALTLALVACSSADAPSAVDVSDGKSKGADGGEPADPGGGGPAPSDDGGVPGDGSTPAVAKVRVHYPAGGKAMAIRGARAPLSWTTSLPLRAAGDDTWELSLPALSEPLEWKPMLDDAWSRGPNYRVQPGETVDVYPRFTRGAGAVTLEWPSFTSTVLPSTRGIWVYLPPTYLENTRARFPVLYMHDGKNLFDAALAFGGSEWRVDETLDSGAESGDIQEVIVVGVESTADRIGEMTPSASAEYAGSGKGSKYLAMIRGEIKPMVDQKLRTLPGRDHTFLMGSSLGGLISAYAGVTEAQTFGAVGCMSPSTWWDDRMILGELTKSKPAPGRPFRVYVDSGDAGQSMDGMADTVLLADAYRALGYTDGKDFRYVLEPGGVHNETAWARRLPAALSFLVGKRAHR